MILTFSGIQLFNNMNVSNWKYESLFQNNLWIVLMTIINRKQVYEVNFQLKKLFTKTIPRKSFNWIIFSFFDKGARKSVMHC